MRNGSHRPSHEICDGSCHLSFVMILSYFVFLQVQHCAIRGVQTCQSQAVLQALPGLDTHPKSISNVFFQSRLVEWVWWLNKNDMLQQHAGAQRDTGRHFLQGIERICLQNMSILLPACSTHHFIWHVLFVDWDSLLFFWPETQRNLAVVGKGSLLPCLLGT